MVASRFPNNANGAKMNVGRERFKVTREHEEKTVALIFVDSLGDQRRVRNGTVIAEVPKVLAVFLTKMGNQLDRRPRFEDADQRIKVVCRNG